MALAQLYKDPEAVLDFGVDWSSYLDSGDEIDTSAWAVDAGITIDDESNTTTLALVRISGGTAGNVYTAKNTVTLTSGQIDVRRLEIVVQEL